MKFLAFLVLLASVLAGRVVCHALLYGGTLALPASKFSIPLQQSETVGRTTGMSNYTYSLSSQVSDMSSYVAVSGRPESNYCCVFGLTPQELRYLKVYNV